jgi:hypothetical protein
VKVDINSENSYRTNSFYAETNTGRTYVLSLRVETSTFLNTKERKVQR